MNSIQATESQCQRRRRLVVFAWLLVHSAGPGSTPLLINRGRNCLPFKGHTGHSSAFRSPHDQPVQTTLMTGSISGLLEQTQNIKWDEIRIYITVTKSISRVLDTLVDLQGIQVNQLCFTNLVKSWGVSWLYIIKCQVCRVFISFD